MTVPHILVVDDEPDIRDLVREILQDEGFSVSVAANGNSARQARRERRPDLILLDIWMPDIDGITLLKEWCEEPDRAPPVVMMSGHATVETAVEATRLGAYDFLEKPLSLAKLLLTVRHALDEFSLRRENVGLRRNLRPLERPLGRSATMEQVRAKVERVAATEAWVLLNGEAGTGRRLLARYLHEGSPRQKEPYLELGVATLTPAHAARELFGEESGDKIVYGCLEQADRGTLFLNEVSEMDLEMQARLVSALQSHAFVRCGGTTPIKMDVRLVASTQKNILSLVRAGRFREDLYYLLNVVPIAVPPLRERQDDIPELIAYYTDFFVQREGLPYRSFSVAAQNRLRHYEWPGNVRELKNLVQRLLILGQGDEISGEEVTTALGSQQVPKADEAVLPVDLNQPLREARDMFERFYFEHHLRVADNNISQVAKIAGIERTHLYRKMKALGINPKEEGS